MGYRCRHARCTHGRARAHTHHTHAHLFKNIITCCRLFLQRPAFTGHHGHLHGLVAAGSMAWLSRKCVQIASRVSLFLGSLLPGRALVKLSAREVPVPWERSSPQERVESHTGPIEAGVCYALFRGEVLEARRVHRTGPRSCVS